MESRKDRFTLPWRVVELPDAFQVVDAAEVVVSLMRFRVDGTSPKDALMTREEAKAIADRMVGTAPALARLSKDTSTPSRAKVVVGA